MGIFGNKKEEDKKVAVDTEAKVEVVKKSVKEDVKSVEAKAPAKTEAKVKKVAKGVSGKKPGGTDQAHRILIKPLITEKATDLGGLNKYVFEVGVAMNKVEVKKAIRTVYNVDPIKINMLNFSGKSVRFGRIQGRRKGWKKAVVTLKKGDKIEVYEGV